jgi:hypothetical protein
MSSRTAILLCAALLVIFAGFSFATISRNSPTYDEPLETLGGWIQARQGDYRIFFEDPPLTHYWAALANGPDAIHTDLTLPSWSKLGRTAVSGMNFTLVTLFKTPSNDPLQIISRARAMMVPLGVLLGVMIALWAWRLGGARAAVIATGFFAFDPNLIAHSAVVKSDVAMTLVSFAFVYMLWRVGQRVTWRNVMLSAVLMGIALNTKFSGVMVVFIAAGLIGLRVLMSESWKVGSTRLLENRTQRLVLALALMVAMGATSVGITWASYRFRYAASPTAELGISQQRLVNVAKTNQIEQRIQQGASIAEAEAGWQPGFIIRVIEWMSAHRVLPEAWLNGILFVHAHSAIRESFLFDRINQIGWPSYFPFAFLFKTPTVTIAALLGTVVLGVAWLSRKRLRGNGHLWTALCGIVPLTVYSATLLSSHLNIGYRHLFPVLPYLFLAIGVAGSAAVQLKPRIGPIAVGLFLLALAAESLPTAPHFLSFFNAAVGGPRQAVHLLGDSNLDWGQSLPALAAWQREHPNEVLYFSSFGPTPPELYGLEYRGLPGNSGLLKKAEPLVDSAVVALSATHLQGLYLSKEEREFIRPFRRAEPMEVVGDSIFLYRWPVGGGRVVPAAIAPTSETK